MVRTKQFLVVFLLLLLQHLSYNEAVIDIPELIARFSKGLGPCAEYFTYVQDDFAYIGKLILPNMSLGDTVKLEIRGPDSLFKGSVLLNESTEMVMKKIEDKQPISFRVDFPFRTYKVELEKIFINGKEQCSAFETIHYDKYTTNIETTLEIINGSLPVFKFNPIIPHFPKYEVAICGFADEEITKKRRTEAIYMGEEIQRGEYPWMAAIYKSDRTGISFLCGGSLVTSEIVVSAAHCFHHLAAKHIVVYLGLHNLTKYLEDGTEARGIDELILHPDYNKTPDADLALLKMTKPVSFTRFIKPICLWSESADESLIVNKTGMVAGWGKDENGYTLTDVPKKVTAKIVSEVVCMQSDKSYNNLTSSRTLCAGNLDGSGPCSADSGGGLMIQQKERWILRGVVSTVQKDLNRCYLDDQYVMYCDIAKHMPWLSQYVKQRKPEKGDENDRPITGPASSICGKSGTEKRTEYPWLAAIYKKYPTGMEFRCSGALISSRIVLSAATCIDLLRKEDVNDFRVFLGRYDLESATEDRVVARDLAAVVYHPENYANDIAIFQMKDPIVVFTQYVKPICLWSEVSERSLYEEKSAILLSYNSRGVQNRTLVVPQVSKGDIDIRYNPYPFEENHFTPFLCINHSLAESDGGLLMIEHSGQWKLLGTVVHTKSPLEVENCVADITNYFPWIKMYL